MAVCALYKHPWFITMWTGKEYKLDFIVGFEGVRVDAWLYSDHQRYFFFQQATPQRDSKTRSLEYAP